MNSFPGKSILTEFRAKIAALLKLDTRVYSLDQEIRIKLPFIVLCRWQYSALNRRYLGLGINFSIGIEVPLKLSEILGKWCQRKALFVQIKA